MSTWKIAVATLTAWTFLYGCASKPEAVSASYVSPLTYQPYDCDQIRGEMMRVNRHVMEITGQQQNTADRDAVALGVGLVIFWPALFFMIGGDKSQELGRLKGEYDALEQAAILKKCDVATELAEARRQRDEQAAKRQEAQTQSQKKGSFGVQ
jgi:hypothetical protein